MCPRPSLQQAWHSSWKDRVGGHHCTVRSLAVMMPEAGPGPGSLPSLGEGDPPDSMSPAAIGLDVCGRQGGQGAEGEGR